MPKVQSSVFSRQSSAKEVTGKEFLRFFSTTNQLLTTNSQRGVAQLALVLLLLAGVAVGTYVVQNRTNISPNAEEGSSCNEDTYYCEGDKKIHKTGGYADDSGNCVYDYQDAGSCQENSDNNNETEANCAGEWRDGTCYTSRSSNDQGTEGFVYKYTECTNEKPGEVRDVHQNSEGKYRTLNKRIQSGTCGDTGNNENSSDNNQGTNDNTSSNSQQSSDNSSYDNGECRDGAQVFKDGYTWITYCTKGCSKNSDCPKNTTDGAVNPETSNWCYGFNGGKAPRCMMLVQTDNKEVTDTTRKTNNTKAVEEIKATIAKGEDPNPAAQAPTQSSSAEFKAKVDAQNTQRSKLVGELATVLNNLGSGNSALTGMVSKAQTLITSATSNATTCYTGHDKPLTDSCDATSQAANDIAVAASRVALFDAVAAGIQNTCVKVDMAIGEKTSNSLIEVAPADNTNFQSRLFMCRGEESSIGKKDGDIKWMVRDASGVWQTVAQDSLNRLGLRNGQKDPAIIPSDFIARRNNAAALSSLPTYNAPAVASTQSTEKKNLEKNATCEKNSECKSGSCNPGTSKCI